MTAEADLDALSANLARTYLAIAEGVPGTEKLNGAGFRGVVNPFPHPICNFAFCDDSADVDVDTIFHAASQKSHFNIYVSHSQSESRVRVPLERSGFTRRYVLSQMWGSGIADGPRIDLRTATVMPDRVRLAQFMAAQFFSSQPGTVQDKIAFASAKPADLSLHEAKSVEVRRGPLGAVMLHPSPGVMGLYNLCVALPYRARGFGGMIVRTVQAMAVDARASVGLQCDSQLEGWYSQFGINRAGIVSVFGIEKR